MENKITRIFKSEKEGNEYLKKEFEKDLKELNKPNIISITEIISKETGKKKDEKLILEMEKK